MPRLRCGWPRMSHRCCHVGHFIIISATSSCVSLASLACRSVLLCLSSSSPPSPHALHCLTSCPSLPSLLPPGHAGELPQLGGHCDCTPEWRCDPHNTCFIHDSCFCEGSGSWPPVKPIRSYWHRFFSDWKAAMDSPPCPLPFP